MQAVEQLKAALSDQPHNPLRAGQLVEYQEELSRVTAIAEGRDMDGNPAPWLPGNRGNARARSGRIQKVLREQAPKPLDGAQRDTVAKLCADVMANVIQPSMLSRAAMRRNPSGAVDAFMRRENARPVKDAILAWKRGRLALEPFNDEPNYTNVERFRPEGTGDGTSSFMADAQIPGVHAMSSRAKEQWPLGEPQMETALKQVQKREAAAETKKRAITLTPEQRAKRVQQLAAGRAKQKAAREAAIEQQTA